MICARTQMYCETLKSNRRDVPKYSEKKRDEVIGKVKRKIQTIKLVDKRPIYIITTHLTHNPTLVRILHLFLIHVFMIGKVFKKSEKY